ncbi:MAG TPA: hypothetical protein VJB34_03000 [Bdellovibrionota bacterium]|nr:hypothetical protein [Bdellovibrionota bacterium]
MKLFIVIAVQLLVFVVAQVPYCDTPEPKNVTVTFQPHLGKHSNFHILVETRDVLVVKIEPVSLAENIHFIPAFHVNGELVPDIFGGVLSVVELESNPHEPGTKYLALEAYEDIEKYANDISLIAYRAPYEGRKSHVATYPISIYQECPDKGFYRGGDFVEEVCGETHVHENGQTIYLREANSKHVYNAERGLKPGDVGYQAHNENVCQYCLEDEWFWWKTLGALRGAYNGPNSRPVNPLTYFFGETAGAAMGEALTAVNSASEEVVMPVLKVVGIPFEYLESELQKVGISRTDMDAILLHFAVGAVRVPRFSSMTSYARVAVAQKMVQMSPVFKTIRNQRLLQVPEFAFNRSLQPVLVTPNGFAIGQRVFALEELEMFMSVGLRDVRNGAKAIRGAVFGTVGKTFNFFWDTTSIFGFLGDVRKLIKVMRHMKLKHGVIQLIPGFIKKHGVMKSGLVWYPVFLGSLYATGEGPMSNVMPFIAGHSDFFSTSAHVASEDIWNELSGHLPTLQPDEIVVHVDAKASKKDEHHIQGVRKMKEDLLHLYREDQIWMEDVSNPSKILFLQSKVRKQNKKIKLLIWEGYGNPGILGFEPVVGSQFEVSQQTAISENRNLDHFKELSQVMSPDGVLVLYASWVGSSTRGQNFIEDIHSSIVPEGVVIAPTRVCHLNLGEMESLDFDVLDYALPGLLDLRRTILNYFIHIRRLNNQAWVDSSEPIIKVIGK